MQAGGHETATEYVAPMLAAMTVSPIAGLSSRAALPPSSPRVRRTRSTITSPVLDDYLTVHLMIGMFVGGPNDEKGPCSNDSWVTRGPKRTPPHEPISATEHRHPVDICSRAWTP